MIDEATITDYLRLKLPDAMVEVTDLTGTGDHLNVYVRSRGFAGMTMLNQHRAVYSALSEPLGDGRLHALQIKTEPVKDPT